MPFYIWQHKALHYLPLIMIASKTIKWGREGFGWRVICETCTLEGGWELLTYAAPGTPGPWHFRALPPCPPFTATLSSEQLETLIELLKHPQYHCFSGLITRRKWKTRRCLGYRKVSADWIAWDFCDTVWLHLDTFPNRWYLIAKWEPKQRNLHCLVLR